MIKTKNFLIFFLIFSVWSVGAQNYDDFVEGILLDSVTKEPVVFATIRLKGKTLGVISNNDGGFKIPSDFQSIGDTLVISSMGYETKQVVFSTLREGIINQIFIKASVFELTETIVTAKKRKRLTKVKTSPTAEQIIKYAIERIPINYDKNPFELIGYYRDYQLREKKYTNLNEALIKVFDKGFEVEDYTTLQFGLYNYLANLDFKVDSFAAKPYDYKTRDKYIPDAEFSNSIVPNELVLLFNHDAIRINNKWTYSYVNTFIKDFVNGHDFLTYFLTNYGDKKVYKIKFKKDAMPFQVKGDIYIDMDTYAIRKLDYAVYRQKSEVDSSTNNTDSEMALRKLNYARYRQKLEQDSRLNNSDAEMDLFYEILVEYQNYKDKMYLNYISFHNKFKLIRPPEFFIKEAVLDSIKRDMKLVLNKPAVNWLELKPNDFKIFYQKKRLKIKNVVREGFVGDTYRLSFDRKRKAQRKRIKFLFSKIEDREKKSLTVDVDKMVDEDGNFLKERKSEILDQFREFFAQKIITKREKESNKMLKVDKSLSLNDKKQVKIQTKMDEEYWMNTPLKKVSQ